MVTAAEVLARYRARERREAEEVRLGIAHVHALPHACPDAGPAHKAYAALHTALTGSGVLTMAEAEQWARRISAERAGGG